MARFGVETDRQQFLGFAGGEIDAAAGEDRRGLREGNRSFPNDIL
jgi:hypothetical protein